MQNSSPKLNNNILLILILVFGCFIAYSLRDYFTAFLGSLLFYVLFKNRMAHLVEVRKWKRSLSALIIMLFSFFIILVPISVFGTMVYNKIMPLVSSPETLMPYLTKVDLLIQQKVGVHLLTQENFEALKSLSAKFASMAINQSIEVFSSIGMMYFFLYFLLINVNKLETRLILMLPFERQKIKLFSNELKSQTISNAIGIPLIAIAQGFLAYIAYLIIGLPESGFWAILTGFASIIPIVGSAIIWLPISIYFFAVGGVWQSVFIALWGIVVMGSADNVIRFLLAKKIADVHPIITVLGLIIGIDYMGITGLIFGPLLISYFTILVKMYYEDLAKKKQELAIQEE